MELGAFIKSRTGVGGFVLGVGAFATIVVAALVPNDEAVSATSGPLIRSAAPPEQRGFTVAADCPRRDAPDYFYPAGNFALAGRGDDPELLGWFAPYLRDLKEASLSCGKAAGDESYRFLFVPSFHEVIGVRVERTGAVARLHAGMLTGPSGGSIVESTDVGVTRRDWEELLARLSAAHFWESSATRRVKGVDGAYWIIEGRRGDQYWAVVRYCPDYDDEAFAAAGIRFLELAGMRTAASEVGEE